MSVASNIAEVRAEIARTMQKVGRATDAVRLIAVSKTKPAAMIEEALQTDQRVFGENYVQEAAQKFPALREKYPDIELHLIGGLQSNKAALAVQTFDVIQTLDRPSLAAELAKAMRKTGRNLHFYIEVNVGDETQKSGVSIADFEALLKACRETYGLNVEGVMGIPPADEDPAPYFKKLKELADKHGLSHISMGMSADYVTAIACGATEVRVGSALFGARECQ